MHRTHRMARSTFSFLLLSVAAGGLATGAARAGDNTLLPTPGNGVQTPQPPGAASPGAAEQKQPERTPPPMRAPSAARTLTVPVGGTAPLEMTSKKTIRNVLNPKDNVATVTATDIPQRVLVTGKEAGTTRVTLIADDKTEEIVDILVQFDVEYLRLILQRVAPTANLVLSPASSGVIVIGGTVNRSEDIDIIMRTAASVAGSPERVVNAMVVGGVMQVQLDAVVAQVSRSELRRMSFDFLDIGRYHTFASTLGQSIIVPTPGSGISGGLGSLQIPNTFPNSVNGAPANFFLGVFDSKHAFFSLLQILRDNQLGKILAEPKLVTLSGRSAELLSGGQQAIPETAGLGSVSVRFEPFGTRLAILPIVLGNGKIQLEVEPEVSTIDAAVGTSIAGTVVPGRDVQRVHTTVVIEDGQTLAIGGLIQSQVVASTTKVPVLGDLPYFGVAFSRKSYQETETELVVLVTPHLVDPMACNQVPHLLPGQETRAPDDCELFLEGIMEAPRGPREVCVGGRYVPAYKNGPTAEIFPCAGNGCHGGACAVGCGGGCGTLGCGTSGVGAAPGHVVEVPGKPMSVAGSSPAPMPPGELSKSAEAAAPLPPSPPAVLPSAESAKSPTPAELPAETTKAPAVPAGENQAPAEGSAKAAKPFTLPSVGNGTGADGQK